MPDPTPNRPLWQVMSIASGQLLDDRFGEATPLQCRAAELRAIAAEIESPFSNWQRTTSSDLDIIAWLRAEADRAEAGE